LIVTIAFMNFSIEFQRVALALYPISALPRSAYIMKRQLLLSLTLSVLAANAFAMPAADQSVSAELRSSAASYSQPYLAEDGSDRTPQGTVAENGSDRTPQATFAEDGSDRTPQGTFAENGSDRTPQATFAEDGSDRTPQGTFAENGSQRLLDRQDQANA
jgi:hypothetical protein